MSADTHTQDETERKLEEGIFSRTANAKRFDARPLATDRKPWFRQPGESRQAYEAFMTYLTLPSDERTHKRAAEILGKSHLTMAKFSRTWVWRHRVAAYEEHYMLLKLESVQADRDQMWREQKELASLGMGIVTQHFESLYAAMNEAAKDGQVLNIVKPDALVRLMAESAKLQRMAVLGRIEGAADASEQAERLAERYAEELAQLIGEVVNDIGLSPEQQERAKEVLGKHLVGEDG